MTQHVEDLGMVEGLGFSHIRKDSTFFSDPCRPFLNSHCDIVSTSMTQPKFWKEQGGMSLWMSLSGFVRKQDSPIKFDG